MSRYIYSSTAKCPVTFTVAPLSVPLHHMKCLVADYNQMVSMWVIVLSWWWAHKTEGIFFDLTRNFILREEVFQSECQAGWLTEWLFDWLIDWLTNWLTFGFEPLRSRFTQALISRPLVPLYSDTSSVQPCSFTKDPDGSQIYTLKILAPELFF